MWTKILYKGINKSNFSLHQLVIKRKEKKTKEMSSIVCEVIGTVFFFL